MSTQPRSSKLMALVAGLCSLVIATAELTGPHTYAVEYCFGKQAYRAMCSSVVLVGGSSHSFSLVAESRESFYILRIEPARRLGPIRCRPARGLGGAVPDCAILDSQSTVPGEYVYEVAAVKALPTSTVISPTSDLAWEAANACCSIIWTSAGKVTFPEKDWIDDEAEVTMLCGPGEDASALIPRLPGVTCALFFSRIVESKGCDIIGGSLRPTFELKKHSNHCDWRDPWQKG